MSSYKCTACTRDLSELEKNSELCTECKEIAFAGTKKKNINFIKKHKDLIIVLIMYFIGLILGICIGISISYSVFT